jgi:hypothetical protein
LPHAFLWDWADVKRGRSMICENRETKRRRRVERKELQSSPEFKPVVRT